MFGLILYYIVVIFIITYGIRAWYDNLSAELKSQTACLIQAAMTIWAVYYQTSTDNSLAEPLQTIILSHVH